ncbi:tail fiber protein, partial [Paenibacillus alvei]
MGAFGGIVLTNKGRNLQAKAQTGIELKYTRIGIGDGQLVGQSIPTLTKLINEKKSLPLTKLKLQGQGKAVLGAVLSNQEVTTGFYFREVGVFAQDPDEGEILYGYGNSGANAEYIPPAGGADIIEKSIDAIIIVGQAQNVSAIIDSSLIFASQDDVDAAEARAKAYTDQKVKDIDLSKITPESIGAAKQTDFTAHLQDNTKHITVSERNDWNSKAAGSHKHDASDITTGTMAAARLPGATTSAAGIVQLSTATNGTRANVAATESAVKAAYDRANEAFQSASDGKNQVAAAITGKGIPASGSDTYPVLAQKISQITTGVPMARITTSVSEWPKNFLISEGDTTTWGLYYIVVTGLSFQAKGIVVFSKYYSQLAAFDLYTN